MTDFNTNELSERAESFDAFVQWNVGSHHYRLKSIQEVTVNYQWTDEDRYADDGTIQLVRTGQQHTATVNLVLTNSEVDNASTPSDEKTISYWLAQREAGNRVQLNVVQVFVTKASSTNVLRNKFVLDITRVGLMRNVGGVVVLPVEGRIVTHTSFKRESS